MVNKDSSAPLAVITGGTGFIGSHLTEHLIQHGYKVRCLVRPTSNLRWIESSGAEINVCPLDDQEALEQNLKDADYVIHLAGVVKARNLDGYLKGNVETTRNILDTLLKINTGVKKVLVTSSLAVVGPNKPGHPSNEESPYNPISHYGKSKVAQENLCHEYQSQLPIVIIRPPSVYGPRDGEIYTVFKAMAKGVFATVGFNRKTLSMIYIDDLVRGMRQALESNKSAGQTYFISSEEEYDWNQIAKYGKAALGKGFLNLKVPHSLVHVSAFFAENWAGISGKAATLNREKAKEVIQESWACSPKKAMKDFGFRQEIGLEEGFKHTVAWYRENGWI